MHNSTMHPADRITGNTINKNDAFRRAFNLLCQHALPHMAEDAYFSDLLYDAATAAGLAEGERVYILVRALGTNCYRYRDDAIAHCDPRMSDGRAVLRVVRRRFDNFDVETVHVLPASTATPSTENHDAQ